MSSCRTGSQIWIAGLDDKERVEKTLGQEYATLSFNERPNPLGIRRHGDVSLGVEVRTRSSDRRRDRQNVCSRQGILRLQPAVRWCSYADQNTPRELSNETAPTIRTTI